MRRVRQIGSAVAILTFALVASACTTGEAAPRETTEPTMSAAAEAALEKAYVGAGSDLSDLQPVTPEAGVSLYVMSCGESLASCHDPAAAMVDAAEAAGWTGAIADGKLSPEGFAAATRQATAAGADVIVPIGNSCSAAAAAFAEAKAAGVAIVGGGGLDDCDPPAWASERLWLENPPAEGGMFGAIGMLQADYAFGRTDGDVKAVVLNSTASPWGVTITDAFATELEALGGGEVLATVDVSGPETADGSFIQKVTSALLANPDANALIVYSDGLLVNGLAAAIAQAGLDDKVLVVGAFGSEAALDMIRSGQPGIDATIAAAQEWEAWGSVDTAIRVLAGQEPAYIGQKLQAVDADRNMPESGAFTGGVDWKDKFLKSWGK